MQRVWGLRWGLKNIDGALRDEPDVEYHAKGELAVTYQAIGESQLRDATVRCWSDPSLDDCEADGENDPVTEPTIVAELPPEVENDDAMPLISPGEPDEIRTRVLYMVRTRWDGT